MTEQLQTSLPVMEHFYTIQGEGFHQGKAAYFIRLGGCDVGCTWCDVKDSWEMGRHPLMKTENLADMVKHTHARIVVITGGEPLMHDLENLTGELHLAGLQVHIETSGSWPLSGRFDWITLSPKKFKFPLPEVLPLANELKIIIYNHSDFEWAEKWASQMQADCRLYLQPEWSRAEKMIPLIIDYIQEHPQWQLSLQIHKYIGMP